MTQVMRRALISHKMKDMNDRISDWIGTLMRSEPSHEDCSHGRCRLRPGREYLHSRRGVGRSDLSNFRPRRNSNPISEFSRPSRMGWHARSAQTAAVHVATMTVARRLARGQHRTGRRSRYSTCRPRRRPSHRWQCHSGSAPAPREAAPATVGASRAGTPVAGMMWPTVEGRATPRRRPQSKQVLPWRPQGPVARSDPWRRFATFNCRIAKGSLASCIADG